MKNGIVIFILNLFFVFSFCGKQQVTASGSSGIIYISGAWALYPMMVKWAGEFNKLNPDIRIEISAGGAGKGMTDALNGITDLGMISREIREPEKAKGAWWIAVARDAVVATFNTDNPYYREIKSSGITCRQLQDIWIHKKNFHWEELYGGRNVNPIMLFTRSDACGAASSWASFLGFEQENLNGIGIYGDPGLLEAVKKDVWSIGYNNLNYVYDFKTEKPYPGVDVVPLDLDNNGRIDSMENFYHNRKTLTNAIKQGKYPSPPARCLYLASQGKPQKPIVINFLIWILNQGQAYLCEAGYIELSKEILKNEQSKLSENAK